MEFKRFAQCTLNEVISAWNKGFEGYAVSIKMEGEALLKRMVMEDLCPELSVIAFSNGEPIGVVMNGIRTIGEQKVAWNGGTGIATSHRGMGVSNQLMQEVLRIYMKEGVDFAILEAIENNERAIKLYRKFGYETEENLEFLERTISSDEWTEINETYTFKNHLPEQVSRLPIYDHKVPWQCQWQSVKTGEAILALDPDNNIVGYAMYKRIFNEKGEVERISLHQLKAVDLDIVPFLLKEILSGEKQPVKMTTVNFISTDPVTIHLKNLGFERKVGQVHMQRKMK